MNQLYIIRFIETPVGKIPKISAQLNFSDKLGDIIVRFSLNRNNYRVEPQLYAVGDPNSESPVFVSANYKLSFDKLREKLSGLDAWIMVIDTKGINVWCAAGKGTFGTEEIVNRIVITKLKEIVHHRKIIVPQLGAPGISSHKVKQLSGFSVIYGPIRANDIPVFMSSGMKANPEMREVQFSFYDRLILIPIEFIGGLKYLIFISAVFFLLSGINNAGYSVALARITGVSVVINFVLAYIAGTIIGPLLLPWLPGKASALKGAFAGLIIYFISLLSGFVGNNSYGIIAWLFIIISVSSFMFMNFTGASTYTLLSGVKKEMRIAVPMQFVGIILGIVFWFFERFKL
jgi:acetyl-CoA decarbonylase/synthase complex subunit gamma